MSEDQGQSRKKFLDNVYMKIWQADHEYARHRWNIVTFFLSLSFAILGFSFQSRLVQSEALSIRIAGLLIYWFAFLLYQYFYRYTRFLRVYLRELEDSGRTTLDIESRTDKILYTNSKIRKVLSSTRLLFSFGLIYTIGIALLRFLGL